MLRAEPVEEPVREVAVGGAGEAVLGAVGFGFG